MADRFRMVRPNDPLDIPAPQANAWTEAARRVLTSPQAPTAVMLGGKLFPTAVLVEVENASDSDIDQFGVLGINGPMFTPTDSGDFFKSGVALTGVEPSAADHAGKFVVAAEPIPSGSVGRAFVAGVFPCKVNVISEGDAFADAANAQIEFLESAMTGAAQILWKEEGVGEKFAIVRIGGGGGAIPTGQYPGMVLQVIVGNVNGFGWVVGTEGV